MGISFNKSPFASRTLWFNGIAVLVAVAGPVLNALGYTGEVPSQVTVFIPALIAGVNMLIRYFLTDTAVRS